MLCLIRGRRTRKCPEIWAFYWLSGISLRLLQAKFPNYCRWRRIKSSKAERSFLWNCHYWMLPTQGIFYWRSFERNVSGRRFRTACRRHHESFWGKQKYPREPSVISIKRHMSILKPDVHAHWLTAIRMSMLMVSIWNVVGVVKFKTFLSLLLLESATMGAVRLLVQLKAWKKIRKTSVPSLYGWKNKAWQESAWSSEIKISECSKPYQKYSRMPIISAAQFMFIGTFSLLLHVTRWRL